MTEKKTKKSGTSTRQALLAELKANGPQDADGLAEKLKLTAMAVRQHLYAMAEEGDVEPASVKQPVGRPKKMWGLTAQSDQHFANSHATLAVELIDVMKRTFGEEGLQSLVAARAGDQVTAYRTAMAAATTIPARLEKLAALRSEEGYMAAVCDGDQPGEYLFIENHCPICAAATACTNLCASELDVFEQVMGPDVTLERLDHIIMGARRCVYLCRDKKAGLA